MRRYVVVTSPRSEADITAIFMRIADDSPANAIRFIARLRLAIAGLADLGGSLALAPEGTLAGRSDVRQMIFGAYRVIYRIVDDRVEVMMVRHRARLPGVPSDTLESPDST